jgi:uncharacterized protein (TIGR03118 family)
MFRKQQSGPAANTISLLVLLLSPGYLLADSFVQTNLVSSVNGLAYTTDPNLINPWGVAYSATSPFWLSDQGSGKATLYDGAGNPVSLIVSVPGAPTGPSGPTGQVFNGTTGFDLPDSNPARFIFDTLNGTIAGWNGGNAVTMVTTPGAVYTGLALASSGGSNYLYAADSTGQIRVFNSSFAPVSLAGNFTDPNAPAGYVPFNIQLIGANLYVTYAQLTPAGAALPGGFVDEYSTNGTFISRFSSSSALQAPWGITLAPASFGSFGDDLLVGNFGNGEINAFDPTTGALLGTIDGTNNQPLVNDNLWAIGFRTGGTNIETNALYFTAGIDNQSQGLFGAITPTPEPASWMLAGFGVMSLGWLSWRRRRA